jgi:hypothetical protein
VVVVPSEVTWPFVVVRVLRPGLTGVVVVPSEVTWTFVVVKAIAKRRSRTVRVTE